VDNNPIKGEFPAANRGFMVPNSQRLTRRPMNDKDITCDILVEQFNYNKYDYLDNLFADLKLRISQEEIRNMKVFESIDRNQSTDTVCCLIYIGALATSKDPSTKN